MGRLAAPVDVWQLLCGETPGGPTEVGEVIRPGPSHPSSGVSSATNRRHRAESCRRQETHAGRDRRARLAADLLTARSKRSTVGSAPQGGGSVLLSHGQLADTVELRASNEGISLVEQITRAAAEEKAEALEREGWLVEIVEIPLGRTESGGED